MSDINFDDGCMWDGGPWKISFNHECSEYGGGKPCKHCHSHSEKIHTRGDGSTYSEGIWVCPRVVIAENEGGCNSTGVCLDCILAAALTITPTPPAQETTDV